MNLLDSLFGTQYFGFIASAYGVTFVVLMSMIVWVLVVQRQRRDKLARMEEAGLRRKRPHG
ncbi:MAG: heme exporter protein CcmD [Ahrensia sp.]|nr:heme exporter protein CcmD [Ahrensia sp.]